MGTLFRISSRSNSRFKAWRRMIQRPEEPQVPWLAVEGLKAARQLADRYPAQLLLVEEGRGLSLSGQFPGCDVGELPHPLLRLLSQVENSQGAIAFFEKPHFEWEMMPPWLLLLDRLQDPGNLGTLLRTAAATGRFGLVASPGTVSFFNPKVVRASAGALFSTPFLESISVRELKDRGYRLCVADAGAPDSLFELSLRPGSVFAIGNEGAGLSSEIVASADAAFSIPMAPAVESLNAAVAGSLIMYEVLRRCP